MHNLHLAEFVTAEYLKERQAEAAEERTAGRGRRAATAARSDRRRTLRRLLGRAG